MDDHQSCEKLSLLAGTVTNNTFILFPPTFFYFLGYVFPAEGKKTRDTRFVIQKSLPETYLHFLFFYLGYIAIVAEKEKVIMINSR